MIEFIKWWAFLVVIGWIAFPLVSHFFRNQPTKGLGLSKVFALLIWSYLFWIGHTFSIFSNSSLSGWLTLLFIMGTALFAFWKSRKELVGWVRSNLNQIIFSEILFLLASVFMFVVRSASPDILGTEKPMELAFINAISQSDQFPPNDPWLSGYSISYYYFGYWMVNSIVKVLATPTGIAFNLTLIFWFGLIAAASADLLVNLLAHKKQAGREEKMVVPTSTLLASLAAPLLILIVSNSEGILELFHSLGLFWQTTAAGIAESRFWAWLDIQELVAPPPIPLDWNIQRPGGTWWWRASRVLRDYTLIGHPREIIDEFPFFSFFLGDLHPHLLTMPFVLLCISSAFEIFVRDWNFQSSGIGHFLDGFRSYFMWVLAGIFGSLIFLNTWDFPIYFALLSLIFLAKGVRAEEKIIHGIKISLPTIITLGVMALALYSPFLISFSSQAGGLLPSLVFQSRSIHQAVMFLPLLLPIALDLIHRRVAGIPIRKILTIFAACLGIFIFGILLSYLYTAITIYLPDFEGAAGAGGVMNAGENPIATAYLAIYGAEDPNQLVGAAIRKVLSDPWAKLAFLLLAACAIALIFSSIRADRDLTSAHTKSDGFWGLLVLIASLLVLFPEVFYLRDQFGWRMNTIFKFYFQAWILFGISAAYSLVQIIIGTGRSKKGLLVALSLIGIISGLAYPYYAMRERTRGYQLKNAEIDGNHYMTRSNPDEVEAVKFLQERGCGVIVEAVGGSYTNYGRISKLSGCPAVLGWPGHEMQWRGSSDPLGNREADISDLYTTRDWMTAYGLLEKYAVEYIVIGDLERSSYPIEEDKFTENMPLAFQNNSVVIYMRINDE